MTVGDFQSNPTYSVIADPMNPTDDAMDMLADFMRQDRQGAENVFVKGGLDLKGTPDGDNLFFQNTEIYDKKDPKVKMLVEAWVNDRSNKS